jgi:hypothetical protein
MRGKEPIGIGEPSNLAPKPQHEEQQAEQQTTGAEINIPTTQATQATQEAANKSSKEDITLAAYLLGASAILATLYGCAMAFGTNSTANVRNQRELDIAGQIAGDVDTSTAASSAATSHSRSQSQPPTKERK